MDKMSDAVRAKIERVISRPSMFRRLPAKSIPCDPEMFVFLVRYPEVIVNLWQLMGVTNVQVRRTGDFELTTSDGAGTVSDLELVYGTRNMHVAYAEGYYEGPLFRQKLKGRCVLVLHADYQVGQDQRVQVTSSLDVFLQLDNVGADLIAKTLHPLVGRTVDYNFTESTKFLGHVSRAAESNGGGVGDLADRLTGVEAEVRTEFARLARVVGERESIRMSRSSPSSDGGYRIIDETPPRSPSTFAPSNTPPRTRLRR